MFKINFITPDDERFDAVKAIREAVFIQEQNVNPNEEFDSFDEYGSPCTFAILYDNDIIAATGRLCITDDIYKIGRIAVLPAYRGKGYGDAVVRTMLTRAFSMGAQFVRVDAQTHAVGFYEKIGFQICADVIKDRGIEHRPMMIKHTDLCACGGCNG